MRNVILPLLQLFRGRAPDPETNAWVIALATDRNKWPGAHDLFSRIRQRSLDTEDHEEGARVRWSQYVFEELCLKSLYNETHPRDPFDPSSPSFVTGFAIRLARAIGVPVPDVLGIVEAQANPETAWYRGVFPGGLVPTVAATSVPGRLVASEQVAKEFPDLQQFPRSHPGPYERNMGDEVAGLLGLFQGRVPDATSNAIVLQLVVTPERWSAGHALFDILHDRLLVAMRARDQVRYLQHNLECSCLQALYNASSPVHPFAPGTPFWVAGAVLRLAKAVGIPEQTVVAILAPTAEGGAISSNS